MEDAFSVPFILSWLKIKDIWNPFWIFNALKFVLFLGWALSSRSFIVTILNTSVNCCIRHLEAEFIRNKNVCKKYDFLHNSPLTSPTIRYKAWCVVIYPCVLFLPINLQHSSVMLQGFAPVLGSPIKSEIHWSIAFPANRASCLKWVPWDRLVSRLLKSLLKSQACLATKPSL